jgi:glutaredoxin 3
MADVRMYTTRTCAYCFAAKRLLAKKGVAFVEVDVSKDTAKRAWLVAATGRRTVPQIFIGDEPIGGYEELKHLDRTGELATKLAAPAAGSPA